MTTGLQKKYNGGLVMMNVANEATAGCNIIPDKQMKTGISLAHHAHATEKTLKAKGGALP
eukprot:scaffold628654_cov14-Prasinocladus_malaysianus.AAC.1